MKKILPLLFVLLCTAGLYAQEKTEGEGKTSRTGMKSYTEIIPESAVSYKGLFTVHQVDGKCYFELPLTLLEKEILVVSVISGYVRNLNFGGGGYTCASTTGHPLATGGQ